MNRVMDIAAVLGGLIAAIALTVGLVNLLMLAYEALGYLGAGLTLLVLMVTLSSAAGWLQHQLTK